MSSFTDVPIQYNPYVETTPIQAEVAVGMRKEEEFKLGIARVQSYVDAIAGLDIVKQEDKDYVTNKLGEVRKGISKNLSGDFSDMRITNQIGGAATHIYKDPIVQNGVVSTANYRKGVADMDAAVKAGKSAPDNEWDYQDQANKWLTDKTVGTSFNGKYTPYVDVMDDFLKTWKEVHPDSKLTQDAFRLDSTGKIVVNEALNEESIEGITPDKVKQVSDLVFSKAQNQQQLNISGRYKYRNIPPSTMYDTLRTNYSESLDNVNKKLIELQTKQTTDKTVDKELIAKQIEGWKKYGSDTLDQFKEYSNLLQSDPEAAKSLLYKDEFTQKVMNTFQWTKESNQIKDNPLWKSQMELLKYELDIAKFDWEKEKDKAELTLKQLKLDTETGGKGVATVTVPMNVEDIQGNAGSQSFYDIQEGFHKRFSNDMREGVNLIANASTGDAKIFPPWKKDPNLGWIPNVDPTVKTGYKNAKEAIDASGQIYSNARATWNNGSGSDPLVNDMFNKLDPTLKAIEYYDEKGKLLEDKHKPLTNKLLNILPKDFKRVISSELTGAKIGTVTASDIALYWQYKNGDAAISKIAGDKLKSKFGGIDGFEVIKHAIEDNSNPRTGQGKGVLKDIYDEFHKQAKKDPTILPGLQAKEQDFKDAQIGFNPGKTNFVPKDENQAKGIIGRVRALAETRSTGNDASSFTDILDELRITKDKDTDAMAKSISYYKMPSAKGDKYFISVNGKPAEVTKVDLQAIFPGTELDDPFWNKFGTTLGLTGLTTTDVGNRGIERAFPIKMPYNSKYFVKYHLVGDGNGNYAIKLYIKDTKGNVIRNGESWSLGEGLMTQEQTQRTLNSLGKDATIEAIINQNK